MLTQFFTIGLIALLATMTPGPDFALVTKNSLFYSKKSGYFTAFGVGAAISVHMSYCILGLAIVISSSLLLFNLVKYVGATYLIYLGINSLLSKKMSGELMTQNEKKNSQISY